MKRRSYTNGDRFGRLVVVKTYDPADPKRTIVRCDCGVEKSLVAGTFARRRSCGCLARETKFKHGMCATLEYHSWNAIFASGAAI